MISKAYQVLSEPEKRKLYDECGKLIATVFESTLKELTLKE